MRSRTCNKWIVKSTECWFFPRTKLDQILSKTGFLNLSPWRQPKPLTMQSMRYGGVVGVVASPVPEISSISTCKDFLARKSSKRNPKHNTNYLIKLYLWHLTCRDWKLQNVHQNFVYISCLLISYIKIFQKKLGKNDQTTNLNHIKLNIFDFLLPILANSIVPSCCCQLVLAGSARSSASAGVLPRLSERSRLGWDRFLASQELLRFSENSCDTRMPWKLTASWDPWKDFRGNFPDFWPIFRALLLCSGSVNTCTCPNWWIFGGYLVSTYQDMKKSCNILTYCHFCIMRLRLIQYIKKYIPPPRSPRVKSQKPRLSRTTKWWCPTPLLRCHCCSDKGWNTTKWRSSTPKLMQNNILKTYNQNNWKHASTKNSCHSRIIWIYLNDSECMREWESTWVSHL